VPAKSEKQANLFHAALGDPKPGTGAAKIKASMPREKIKHFTSVGEGTMETLPEGSYNPRDDQFARREYDVETALKKNGLKVKMIYHMGAGEVGDPFESEFEVFNPKTGKSTTFTLREHYSLTLVLNGKKIRFPR